MKNVLQKNSQPRIKELIVEPCMFLPNLKHINIFEDQRLYNIFRMCLESSFDDLRERLLLTSPKNFVVQYFTVSRNQPVKVGCETHPPNEIRNDITESPYVISSQNPGNSHKDEGRPRSYSNRGCNAGELLKLRKNTQQQTDPEPSWQEKCSNFIINLPETLSDKFFGPRITRDESTVCKRTVVGDNSKLNRSRPLSKNFSRRGSTDERNESPTIRECNASLVPNRVCLEKINQVDICHSRTFHSVHQEDVAPCRRSGLESENCKVTRRKMTSKCCKSYQDRLPPTENSADRIQSRNSDPHQPEFKFETKNSTKSSFSDRNEKTKAFPSFSNWPAFLGEKLFGSRPKEVESCMVDDEVIRAKARRRSVDSPENVSACGLPSEEKKGRLSLKKYTISQTPDAMEETLFFNILPKEQLSEIRTKLQSKVCVKFTSDNQQKLDTAARKWNTTEKCSDTGGPHTSKRCVKSEANHSRSGSRKIQQLEKKTSTGHIFLSSLIMKLLNRQNVTKDTTHGTKCHRERASGRRNASSIDKDGNDPSKCVEDVRTNEVVLCSLKQKIRSDSCTDEPEFFNVAGKDEIREEITSDYSSGRKEVSAEVSSGRRVSEEELENVTDFSKKVTPFMRRDCTDRLENTSSQLQGEYQDIRASCGSSKTKTLVKSGALKVIDERCPREARGFHTSHRKKFDTKLTVGEKNCKVIPSPNKFSSRVRKLNRIENNDSRLECRGCLDRDPSAQRNGTTEKGICVLTHGDKLIPQKIEGRDTVGESEIPTPENCNVIICQREKDPSKQCPSERLTVERICERLIIRDNGIFNSTQDRGLQCFGESPRSTVVVAGENICVKMFYDRETITDNSPEAAHCHKSEVLRKKNQCTPVKKITKVRTSSPTSHKPGQNITKVPQRSIPVESLHSEPNGSGSMQKQSKNDLETRVGSEERVGLLREDNTSGVSPGGIPKDDDGLGTEPVVGKVFSPLCRKASEKCENKVFEGKACPHRASIKSESQEALLQCHSKDNDCSSPLVVATTFSSEGQSDSKKEGAVGYQQSSNHSRNSERLDVVELNIDSPEKRGSWENSSGKDLSVTKPESRNIINWYYSRRGSDAFSRCEVRNDEHSKLKKGKEERESSGADKSITKARKPLQRIENSRQVGHAANVAIKSDTSKKRIGAKENSIADKKAPTNHYAGVVENEAKDYLVQSVATDNSTLPRGFIVNGHTSPIQELKNRDSIARARTTASKIPRKSGPLSKSESPIRAYSAAKAPESQNAMIKENLHRNWLANGSSKMACSETNAKETEREAGKIAESEFSNGVTGSIDTREAKGSEIQKELQEPAYIFDEGNVKVRTLQVETSNVEKSDTQNDGIVKGTGEAAYRRGSKSGKSPSRQRDGKRDEDGRSRIAGGGQNGKENIQAMENQSKSETASKKNEEDEKSAPLKVLSQNDFAEIDADISTQGRVTTNVDLFDAALMDGKNNIQSYSDLQSADEENSNAHRVSAPKDDRLQKSRTTKASGKPKVFRPSKGLRTSNARMNNARKSPNPGDKGSKTNKSFNTADTDEGKKDTNTSLANVHDKSTRDSLSLSVNSTETGNSTICENKGNSLELVTTSEGNSKKIEHLKVTGKDNHQQNSIAVKDRNLLKSCTAQRAGNHVPSKNIAAGQSSARTHERLSSKSVAPTHRTKRGTSMSSSRGSSDFNKEINHRSVHRNILAPVCKSREYKDALNSSSGGKSKNVEQPENDCTEDEEDTDNDSAEVIADTVSRVLCKGVSYMEKEIVQNKYDDVPEEPRTFCDTGKSNDDWTRKNFSSTDSHKLLQDQGPDFLTLRKKRNSADCKKLNNEGRDSNNSISSIQKAYSALKTMLNDTKNIYKGFMYTKQTRGTQVYPRTLDQSSVFVEDCVKSRKNEQYLGSKISDDHESLMLSISFESSILSDSSSPACTKKHEKL